MYYNAFFFETEYEDNCGSENCAKKKRKLKKKDCIPLDCAPKEDLDRFIGGGSWFCCSWSSSNMALGASSNTVWPICEWASSKTELSKWLLGLSFSCSTEPYLGRKPDQCIMQ